MYWNRYSFLGDGETDCFFENFNNFFECEECKDCLILNEHIQQSMAIAYNRQKLRNINDFPGS